MTEKVWNRIGWWVVSRDGEDWYQIEDENGLQDYWADFSRFGERGWHGVQAWPTEEEAKSAAKEMQIQMNPIIAVDYGIGWWAVTCCRQHPWKIEDEDDLEAFCNEVDFNPPPRKCDSDSPRMRWAWPTREEALGDES